MSADDSTVRGSWPGGYRGAGSDMLGWVGDGVCVGLRRTRYHEICVRKTRRSAAK